MEHIPCALNIPLEEIPGRVDEFKHETLSSLIAGAATRSGMVLHLKTKRADRYIQRRQYKWSCNHFKTNKIMIELLKKIFGGTTTNYKELVNSGAIIIDVRSAAE